jgi:hypothetical protein
VERLWDDAQPTPDLRGDGSVPGTCDVLVQRDVHTQLLKVVGLYLAPHRHMFFSSTLLSTYLMISLASGLPSFAFTTSFNSLLVSGILSPKKWGSLRPVFSALGTTLSPTLQKKKCDPIPHWRTCWLLPTRPLQVVKLPGFLAASPP